MRTTIVSTFPPRACGIGTFAADLRTTLTGTEAVSVADLVAVVHEPSSPQHRGVLATIAQAVRGDYVRTARMLGRLDVDVVLLQHEYGIFGGRDGEYVLSFARELAQPLVLTLHTVLSEPTPHQAEVLTELCAEAELVIVMTDTARRLLVASGACPEEKVRIVPHGAPARITARAASERDLPWPRRSDDGTFRLSTFGLISPGKGLETVIEALPAMIRRHSKITYTIAGRTHPDIAHREGERYRLMLERRVLELGLEAHVEFDDRFLTIDELSDLLAATDVFLTPYGNREQIASGALTFAIAAGCAVVSTPYWYAQDMLASGAGLLVPFGDQDAFAEAVCSYLERPDMLAAARAEAQRIGSSLSWPAVADATASVLQEADELAPRRRPTGVADLHLTSLRSDHLLTLADDVGIVQHAHGIIPNRDSGYCVDDVARLAVVSLALARRGDEQNWTSHLYRALAFLHSAAGDGGMRNFMSYDRRWLDEPHIGDHVGRSIWALGEILATAWIPAVVRPAGDLLDRLVATLGDDDVSLRTAAYTVLGLSRLDADRLHPAARLLLERLVDQLADSYERTSSNDWCWFEDELTYDNARLSQALLSGASALDQPDLAELGLDSLRWLGDECGLDENTLRLPGHRGRRRGEPAPGSGDEQPLDAAALVEAELSAFAVTRKAEHGARAIRAFEWFLGRNRLQRPLYDFATGGCSDGLGSDAVNDNQGAESTLAFHQAALLLDAAGVRAGVRERAPEPVLV
ncbi:MAG TPA: glycosyltransferase family 4 protein [Gaiellaceae bacterium]|nr:glycosyltransferase family 4 protein [Gaiellaceae bacterium]